MKVPRPKDEYPKFYVGHVQMTVVSGVEPFNENDKVKRLKATLPHDDGQRRAREMYLPMRENQVPMP